MHTIQEIQVWFVIPALRRELALALKELSLSQKMISELLDLTEAAVSQYLKGKRGVDMKLSSEVKSAVVKSARKLVQGSPLRLEMQELLKVTEKEKSACSSCPVHLEDKGCGVCYK